MLPVLSTGRLGQGAAPGGAEKIRINKMSGQCENVKKNWRENDALYAKVKVNANGDG